MSRITLSDVAQAAGVDVSTASRVLRGEKSQRVSDETRAKIIRVAEEMQYHPNAIARGLRTSRTYSIGFVVPQIDNPVFSSAIRGAEKAADLMGFSLIISHREPGNVASNIAKLSHMNRVDGLLVASLDDDAVLASDLENAAVPYVLINRTISGAEDSIVLNSKKASEIAVDHLIELGHTKIAHLGGRPGGFNAQMRFEGYRDALERSGLTCNSDLVTFAGYTADGGRAGMKKVLPFRPTAVFAATLMSAAGAMLAIHDAGLKIPEHISIISLHDALIADILYPPLTTVPLPTEEMGRIATLQLIKKIEGKPLDRIVPLEPSGLHIRASTTRLS